MTFISISCPSCGGKIENLESGKDKYFCPYCGNVIVMGKTEEPKPTIGSLIIRGNQYLESSSWKEANQYFDRALDIDPGCVEAYLGKVHAAYWFRNKKEALASNIIFTEDTSHGLWFRYAMQYAKDTERNLIEPYISQERIERIKADKEREKAAFEANNRSSEIRGLKETIERSRQTIDRAEKEIAVLQKGCAKLNARAFFFLVVKVIGFAVVWLGIRQFVSTFDSAVSGFPTALTVIFFVSLAGLIFWSVRDTKRVFTEHIVSCGNYSDGTKRYLSKPEIKKMQKSYEDGIRDNNIKIRDAQKRLKELERNTVA